ncbi:DUF898 family protein [Allofranklinella schreckenbergeri]|uniref:DUF898 family protein n=2 Tax=Allofranklinella schreckenbergeri TaxID=1076744 RepID=A0A3M6R483_9BURK|nr:DUF898 family protein [Allofranklinella schreckenbergeri]
MAVADVLARMRARDAAHTEAGERLAWAGFYNRARPKQTVRAHQKEPCMPESACAAAAPVGVADSSKVVKAYRLKFTGTGAEYFRVWFVNMLLMVLTLGIYTPWARKRTVEYFFGHSVLARSPLEFTAETRRMVIGFFVFLGLYSLFKQATNSQNALLVGLALLAAAVSVPFLWGSARRFRVTATRWRGLRLRFGTSWKEIYWASWPVFVIALVWFCVYAGIDMRHTFTSPSLLEETRPKTFLGLTVIDWILVALGLVVSWLCFVRVMFNYQRLTIERTYIGVEQGVFRGTYGDFVRIWLGATLIAVLGFATVVTGASLLLAEQLPSRFGWDEQVEAAVEQAAAEEDEFSQARRQLYEKMQEQLERSPQSVDWETFRVEMQAIEEARQQKCREPGQSQQPYCQSAAGWWTEGEADPAEAETDEAALEAGGADFVLIALIVLSWLPMLLVFEIAHAYREAKQHRLVWNLSGVSDIARFRCKLSVGGYVWLRLQNWLLTVITLGFFRPFARVREYRARWTSTTVHIRGGASRLQNLLTIQQEGGAFADAVADFAGFDIVS